MLLKKYSRVCFTEITEVFHRSYNATIYAMRDLCGQ